MNDQELDKSKPHSLQDQELQKILIMLYIDFYNELPHLILTDLKMGVS